MTNEEIVQKIQQTGDEGYTLTLRLAKKNRGLCYRIWQGYQSYVELEELDSLSFLACVEAVRYFDGSRGSLFVTVLGWALHRQFQNCMNNNMRVGMSRSLQGQIFEYRKTFQDFSQRYGRDPTEKELCRLLGITEEHLTEIMKAYNAQLVLSIDAPVGVDGDDNGLCLGDTIPDAEDSAQTVTEAVFQENLRNELRDIMTGSLTREQRNAIDVRSYGVADYAMLIGQSKEDVRRNYTSGLKILRRPEHARRLRGYLETDNLFTATGYSSFRRTGTSSPERITIQRIDRD